MKIPVTRRRFLVNKKQISGNVSFINCGEWTHNSDLGNFKNGSYGVKVDIYGFISRHKSVQKILLFLDGKIRQTEKSVRMQYFFRIF